jgi:hypothetical protein
VALSATLTDITGKQVDCHGVVRAIQQTKVI